jgi:hypothetical protein
MGDSRRVAGGRRTVVSSQAPRDQARTEGPVVKPQKKRRRNPIRRPFGERRRTHSDSSVPIENHGVEPIAGPLAKHSRTVNNGANEANERLLENAFRQELKPCWIDYTPREGTQSIAGGGCSEASSARCRDGDRPSGWIGSRTSRGGPRSRKRSGRVVGFVCGASRWGERSLRDRSRGRVDSAGCGDVAVNSGLTDISARRILRKSTTARSRPDRLDRFFRYPPSPARVVSHHSVPSRRDGRSSCAKRFPSG